MPERKKKWGLSLNSTIFQLVCVLCVFVWLYVCNAIALQPFLWFWNFVERSNHCSVVCWFFFKIFRTLAGLKKERWNFSILRKSFFLFKSPQIWNINYIYYMHIICDSFIQSKGESTSCSAGVFSSDVYSSDRTSYYYVLTLYFTYTRGDFC